MGIPNHQELEKLEPVNRTTQITICHACSGQKIISTDSPNYRFRSGIVATFCNDQEKQQFLSKNKLD